MRVVVPGGTGFVGRHFVRELLAHGHEVTVVGRGPAPPDLECAYRRGDLSAAAPRSLLAGHDAIAVLAGNGDVQAALADPVASFRANALTVLRALEAARGAGGTRVLVVSTQRVYAPAAMPLREDSPLDPADPYALAKRTAEEWALLYRAQYGVPAIVVRLFSSYGPGQLARSPLSGVIAIFVARALAGQPLVVHGPGRRDFVYVSDAARGLRLALEHADLHAGPYNLGSGVGTGLWELAELVRREVGSNVPIQARSGGEALDRVADLERASADLGYRPRVMLAEGLRAYVEWCRG